MQKLTFLLFFNSFSIFMMAQSSLITEAQQRFGNASEATLAIAGLMPEEHYDFKPTEEEMSFREQLLHIIGNVNWLTSSYLGGQKMKQDLKKKDYTKAEVITILKEGFAYAQTALANLKTGQLEEKVEFFAGQMTKRQILTLLNDHHTHHRGQIIVYLRLNGIKPPQYKGW